MKQDLKDEELPFDERSEPVFGLLHTFIDTVVKGLCSIFKEFSGGCLFVKEGGQEILLATHRIDQEVGRIFFLRFEEQRHRFFETQLKNELLGPSDIRRKAI